jgi:hypothetical protein
LVEIAFVSAIVLAVAGIVHLDAVALGNNLDETSITQTSQAIMILLCSGLFAASAVRNPGQRGYFAAVATLFFYFFIRENDGVLDSVYHGFWTFRAGLVC